MADGLFLKLGTGEDQVLGPCRRMHHVGWVELLGFYPISNVPVRANDADKQRLFRFSVEKAVDNISAYLGRSDLDVHAYHSVVVDQADLTTGLTKRRFEFFNVSIPSPPRYSGQGAANGVRESVMFEYESMTLNSNPIPDDTIERMLGIFARLIVR